MLLIPYLKLILISWSSWLEVVPNIVMRQEVGDEFFCILPRKRTWGSSKPSSCELSMAWSMIVMKIFWKYQKVV